MVTETNTHSSSFISERFVVAAIGIALVAGFGLGAVLFATLALGLPVGVWWLAAAQAHGHIQLFGWAGLMVFGVGLHFLPRLRGAPLVGARLIPAVLSLLVAGLVIRMIAQPALAAVAPADGTLTGVTATLFPLASILELAGATLGIGILVATGRRGGPIGTRAGLVPVLPLIATSFVALWIALALNAIGALLPGVPPGLLPANLDTAIVQIGFTGFLVPIAIAISARTFPLYFWTPVPATRWLWGELAALIAGLMLRLIGIWGAAPALTTLGLFLEGGALLGFIVSLGVLHRRGSPPNPRRVVPASERASTLLIVPAYGWLGVAGIAQVAAGLAGVARFAAPPPDLERHALGAGFITLLILGMGLRMLPGFQKRKPPPATASWLAVGFAHAAALLRVLPVLVAWLALSTRNSAFEAVLALSGVLGLAAVATFAVALARAERR